jgi:dTDP-4-dehydrorhamnose reductase
MKPTKILVIGVTGMLGNALFSELAKYPNIETYGTARSFKNYLPKELAEKVITGVDIDNFDSLVRVFDRVKPDVVLNCVGLIKQLPSAEDTELAIKMNALFPHQLARLAAASGSRLIHFSTDCVFDGENGPYKESDPSDAKDIYGKTKFLGELHYDHCLTIRTSIIGHGFESHVSLIDWFLSQNGTTKGYTKVIYSGFPTVEIARIIAQYVLPNSKLRGLYQVSSDPISKYDLLKIVAKVYGKKIKLEPYPDVVSDRSLDSTRFRQDTGYTPPSWEELAKKMFAYYQENPNFIKY